MASLEQIFGWFGRGKFPTEKQYKETYSSFWHRSEKLPIEQIFGLKEEIDKVTTNFKGYHTTIEELQATHPQSENRKDFFAWVGTPYPGTVYVVKANGSAWTDTGEVPTQQEIDLAAYAKLVRNDGKKVVYAPDGVTFIADQDLNYGEFADGDNKDNKFVKADFTKDKSLANNTGLEQDNTFAHISNYVPLVGANYLSTNNDRTMVFYDENKVIKEVVNALNPLPQLTYRLVDIQGKGYKYVRFTVANEHVDSVFCYTLTTLTKDSGITADKVRYNGDKVSDVLNGIKYRFGVDEINTSDKNYFTKDIFVRPDSRHSDDTGLGQAGDYPGYSMTTIIPIEAKNGDIVTVNTNQTVVFYTADTTKVYFFKKSLSTDPKQEPREITIDKPDVKYMAFTFRTEWGRDTMYINVKKSYVEELAGIPASSVVHDNVRLDEVLDNMSSFEKGADYGIKKAIGLTERNGLISQNGDVVYIDKNEGLILESTVLEKNSYYLLELGSMITGRVFSSLGTGKDKPNTPNVLLGIPLAMAGRKTTWFKTDDREGQRLHIFARLNDLLIGEVMVAFDITKKCKLYKVDEPYMATEISKLPSTASDVSAFPSATIPEPQWIMWNINGNMYDLTFTTDYSTEPVVVEYFDSNGFYFKKYAVVGGQGRTSMIFENHNIKCKLTNHDGSKFVLKIGDWIPRSTFHFKVNYTDFTQSKNQGGANFVTDWHRDANDTTKKTYPWDVGYKFDPSKTELSRFDKRPRGVIAGIPCLITNYWNPRSAATMNLNRFAENYALDDKNPLHRGFKGDIDYTAKDRWEELCSDTEGETMTDETWQPFDVWSRWMKTNSSAANLETFKAGDGIKYDKENLIDYWLLGELLWSVDNGWANQLWLSFDSVKFYMQWDDMDTCFGSDARGAIVHAPTKEFRFHDMDLYLWTQLNRAYKVEIQERYKTLRTSNRFSVDKFREIYGGYIARFPYEWYEMDFYMWRDRNSIKAGSFMSLERILWFVEERLKFLDKKYEYVI